jgi:hypothetical protein
MHTKPEVADMTFTGSRVHHAIIALLCGIAMHLPISASTETASETVWHFRVYLDDKAIGYHRFQLRQDSADAELVTEAQFDVTFLKIPVFSYRHRNVEVWNDRCLASIASSTDENGKLFRVDGNADDSGFRLTTQSGDTTLPACISTFAYWDKSFLESSQLLNAQTGEYIDVEVSELGEQLITVQDSKQPATRYQLNTGDATIDLWYSEHGQWLALQSTTSSGRVLRYVME